MDAERLVRAIDLPPKARSIAQVGFVHSYDAVSVTAVLGQDGIVYLIDADNSMLLSEIGSSHVTHISRRLSLTSDRLGGPDSSSTFTQISITVTGRCGRRVFSATLTLRRFLAGLTNSGAIKLYDLDALKERNATPGIEHAGSATSHSCSQQHNPRPRLQP